MRIITNRWDLGIWTLESNTQEIEQEASQPLLPAPPEALRFRFKLVRNTSESKSLFHAGGLRRRQCCGKCRKCRKSAVPTLVSQFPASPSVGDENVG